MERTRVITVDKLEGLKSLAVEFIDQYPKGAVVGLSGDLGAGKTAFVRAVVEVICERTKAKMPRVTSPSFVIDQSYAKLNPPVEHFDLYRIDPATDEALIELGYSEAVDRARKNKGFVFVEWPERAVAMESLGITTKIQIDFDAPEGRVFHFSEV